MTNWRRYALPIVLWVYGIAVTVTLVSVWGRAVVIDTDLMAAAASDVASAEFVTDQIEDWLTEELVELPGIDRGTAEQAAAQTVADQAFEAPLSDLTRAVVAAAAAPPGDSTRVDVAGVLLPAIPSVTVALAAQGIDLNEQAVGAFLSSLDPLVVRGPNEAPVVGSGSYAARTFSLATVVGLVTAVVAGGAAVQMSEDRRAMLRSLLTRIAVSALGFAVMFKLGAWVLDPGAGRAPVRTAAARLAGAKLWLPVLVAAGTGGGAWTLRWTRTRVLDRRQGPGRDADAPDNEEEHSRDHQESIH